jgi:hypothetical protein
LTKNVLLKSDGSIFSTSVFKVGRKTLSDANGSVMINNDAFSTSPTYCSVEKYYNLVETTSGSHGPLSGLGCTSSVSNTCRTITVPNSHTRLIGDATYPEFEFSFSIQAHTATMTVTGTKIQVVCSSSVEITFDYA